MIKVEKNIPIPIKKSNGLVGVLDYYKSLKIEIGDSFFIGCTRKDKEKTRTVLLKRLKNQIKEGQKFTTRFIIKPMGIRIWRVA